MECVPAGCLPLRIPSSETQQPENDTAESEANQQHSSNTRSLGDGNLREMFDACDANKDGFVSVEELCDWMQKLGLHITRKGLHQIIASSQIQQQPNADDFLTFPQFVSLVTQTLANNDHNQKQGSHSQASDTGTLNNDTDLGDPQDVDSETRDAFKIFDKDGDGLISPPELRSTLSELGLMSASASFRRINSMIRRVDADGDGQVSFSEFQTMLSRANGDLY